MKNINPNWIDKSMLFPGMWVYKDVFKKDLNIKNENTCRFNSVSSARILSTMDFILELMFLKTKLKRISGFSRFPFKLI